MISKYMLRRRAGGATLYYKTGTVRGWYTNKAEATLYSEESFALRDRANAFASAERQGIDVVVMKVPEPSDDAVYLRELAERIMRIPVMHGTNQADCDRLLAIARDLQEQEEHE